MRTRDELLAILDGVCADILENAVGAAEVAERLVVVVSGEGTVDHATGDSVYREGEVVAFVNDSGVPFVEQADDLIEKVAGLHPDAVLLGGTALIGRSGAPFQKVLAVQLFAATPDLRVTRIAQVEEESGVISGVAPWRDVKPGPVVWAERLLKR